MTAMDGSTTATPNIASFIDIDGVYQSGKGYYSVIIITKVTKGQIKRINNTIYFIPSIIIFIYFS